MAILSILKLFLLRYRTKDSSRVFCIKRVFTQLVKADPDRSFWLRVRRTLPQNLEILKQTCTVWIDQLDRTLMLIPPISFSVGKFCPPRISQESTVTNR